MRLIKRFFYISMLVLLSNTLLVTASEASKNIKTTHPVASAILMDAYRYLGSLEKFSFDAMTTNDDIYHDKMLKEYTHKVHVDLQRSNKLKVNVSGDIKNRTSYLFGDHFTMMDHDLNYYGELLVPKTIDSALDHLFEKFNIKSPLANLLYTDLDMRIAPKKKGYYFGKVKVDGKVCHHIGFSNEKRELQVWITEGKSPLIKKFIIIDKSGKFALRSSTLLRWNTEPNFSKQYFLFKAGKNAIKISVEERGGE